MELEEAIKICTNLIDTLETGLVKFGEKIDLGSKDIGYIEAIEKVLQELKNSIPKKKIEDKIEELEEEFNNYNVDVNCSQDNYYELSDEYAFAEEKIQELLEEN